MCDKTWVHHYDLLTTWERKRKNKPQGEKGPAAEVGRLGHANCILLPLGTSLSALCATKNDHQQRILSESLEDPLVAC